MVAKLKTEIVAKLKTPILQIIILSCGKTNKKLNCDKTKPIKL